MKYFDSKYHIVPVDYESDRVIEARVHLTANTKSKRVTHKEITFGDETVYLEYEQRKHEEESRPEVENEDFYFLADLDQSEILSVYYSPYNNEVCFTFGDNDFLFYNVSTNSKCGTLSFSVKLVELWMRLPPRKIY